MKALSVIFDFLRGLFLGLLAVTPLFVTSVVYLYVVKVMQKKEGIKKIHYVLTAAPVIAVWVMSNPASFPEKLQELSFVAYIPGIAVAVLGAFSVLIMCGERKTPSEEKIETLMRENENLRIDKKDLEFWKTYYKNLYEKDHPDES